jgi:hypothetical protein
MGCDTKKKTCFCPCNLRCMERWRIICGIDGVKTCNPKGTGKYDAGGLLQYLQSNRSCPWHYGVYLYLQELYKYIKSLYL